MKTLRLSSLFIAALEAARFDCTASYVAAGWDLPEARSAAERTFTVRYFRSLYPKL